MGLARVFSGEEWLLCVVESLVVVVVVARSWVYAARVVMVVQCCCLYHWMFCPVWGMPFSVSLLCGLGRGSCLRMVWRVWAVAPLALPWWV